MPRKIYLGTYTKHLSKGIYCANFDSKNGQLSQLELLKECQSPTYLTQLGSDWFSVFAKGDKAGVQNLLTEEASLEDGPQACYLGSDAKRKLLFTANYHTGHVDIFKNNQGISKLQTIHLEGSGPHPHQEKSHPHYADLTPDKHLIVCDLGTDQLNTYRYNQDNLFEPLRSFKLPAGSGPRHILFHPRFKVAYVISELNSTIHALLYNGSGDFEAYQEISTIPSDFPQDDNAASAIKMTQDGNYLYASNRGHNSIACYKIERDGTLTLLAIVPSHGKTPRDMTLSPDDRFLLVGHQDSGKISIFKRNEQGCLELLSCDFFAPEVVCLKFEQ